jgi:hypothetical protein
MLRPGSGITAKFVNLLSNSLQDYRGARKNLDNLQLIPKNSFHEITLPVDPLTHALASYTLKRAAFPRLTRSATIAMLVAGTVADTDSLSKFAGPSAFLTFYRTYFHRRSRRLRSPFAHGSLPEHGCGTLLAFLHAPLRSGLGRPS